MAQKRMSSSNCGNAYMLMYRIIDENLNKEYLRVEDEEIPDEVRSEVLMQDIQANEAKVEREKKSAKM